MELVDLEFREYSSKDLEKVPSDSPVTTTTKDDCLLAEFSDGNKVLMCKKGSKFIAKCTCVEYGDEPCEHIIAAYHSYRDLFEKGKEKSKKENRDIKDEFVGKLTVIFGQPLTGKTTFAMHLAKKFSRVAVIKIDRNYEVSDYGIKASVYPVSRPKDVLDAISSIPAYEDQIVIIDSITSLDAYFMPDEPEKDDPRVANRRARFCDAVMMRLQKFKKGGAVIVIAHEAIKDFRTGEVGPRMNMIALRHADQVIRIVNENGKRKVIRVNMRKVVENPVFELAL